MHCARVRRHVQGGKVLLVAESRAYFTVYRTITDSGMRAYQLDRDGEHGSRPLPEEVHVPSPMPLNALHLPYHVACRVPAPLAHTPPSRSSAHTGDYLDYGFCFVRPADESSPGAYCARDTTLRHSQDVES